MANLLNNTFTTPYKTAPFSAIKNKDFLPAIKEEIQKTKEEVNAITSNAEAPTFENTIGALEFRV